jgi:hypothetical protein
MYTINDHRYPELDSQSSKFLIPNFDDFSGRCCLKERRPSITSGIHLEKCSVKASIKLEILGPGEQLLGEF